MKSLLPLNFSRSKSKMLLTQHLPFKYEISYSTICFKAITTSIEHKKMASNTVSTDSSDSPDSTDATNTTNATGSTDSFDLMDLQLHNLPRPPRGPKLDPEYVIQFVKLFPRIPDDLLGPQKWIKRWLEDRFEKRLPLIPVTISARNLMEDPIDLLECQLNNLYAWPMDLCKSFTTHVVLARGVSKSFQI